MSFFLELAFIFFLGSTSGWVLELFYRHRHNPEKKWINPGLCTGPYLPLYGFGLCLMYTLSVISLPDSLEAGWITIAVRILTMGIGATVIEYIAGIMCLKWFKVRLWDYRDQPGNIQGIICPLFSFFWLLISAGYYLLLHKYIINAVKWLSNNLAFSFVIGLFFGILIIDAANSIQLVAKLKQYAEDNDVVVRYEALKDNIRKHYTETRQRYNFFRPFRSEHRLAEHLKELRNTFEKRKNK